MSRSKKNRTRIAVLITLLVIPVICSADTPVADKPAYSEGDYWVFITGISSGR